MRIRWRGLELPSKVLSDPKFKSDVFGRFIVEPFERGLGTTIGNSLRRILLSSLEGAAVTAIKIKGAQHEFTSLPGVMEDVTDIVLNIKNLVVKLETDEPRVMRLAATGPGQVTADLIEADTAVTILNKDLVICTLTDKVDFEMELRVGKGRGYVPASEQYNRNEDQEIGLIPIDAIYSPVLRVRYKVEETRVGQKTNYDKLILDVWTNGTVTPEMAIVEAAKILRKHLNPFVQLSDIGAELVSEEAAAAASVDEELIRKLNMPISQLDLSVRASNCLESARIQTVADLVTHTEADLLKLRSFGRTSLREVKRKLEELGLDLGMQLPEGVSTTTTPAATAAAAAAMGGPGPEPIL
jgi:DNA-directed RNA polymerase subunit alpha